MILYKKFQKYYHKLVESKRPIKYIRQNKENRRKNKLPPNLNTSEFSRLKAKLKLLSMMDLIIS